MIRFICCLMLSSCLFVVNTNSHNLGPAAFSDGDYCHVYVVNVEKAKLLLDKDGDPDEAKITPQLAAEIETNFPEFRTDLDEETETTKTYQFPKSKLFITASVYYTDESMASKSGVDSMTMGIVVGPKALKSALRVENNAFLETTYYDRDTNRIKKYVRVNGQKHLVGMECKSNGHNKLP